MPSGSSGRVHLIFLIHGLYGSPSNLGSAAEELHRAAESRSRPRTPKEPNGTGARRSRNAKEEEEDDEVEVDDFLSSLEDDWEGSSTSLLSGTRETPRRGLRKRKGKSNEKRASNGHHPPINGSEEARSTIYTMDGPDKEKTNGEEVIVCLAKSFTGSRTWDGVDVNGHRAADELREEIARIEAESKDIVGLSIMGYSLGGLIARYLVGLLARDSSFWAKYPPRTFSTAATPHLGVLKYGSTTNTIVHTIGKRLFSRTGQHLYCLDRDAKGRSLLEIMADPKSIFVKALQRFPKVLIVANGCNDRTVPYPTASISIHDPFVDHETSSDHIRVDADRNLVLSWTHTSGSVIPASSLFGIVPYGEMPGEGNTGILRVERAKMKFPPIFILPWPGPLKYMLILVLPLLVPLWLCFVSTVFVLHTFQSRINAIRDILHNTFHHDDEEYIDNGEKNVDDYEEESPLLNDRIASLRSQAQADTPTDGTSTPPFIPSDLPPNRIPLLLTPRQKQMVHNLDKALPKMQRLIAWYPWIFNTHATLILRDVKKFPFQEDGRAVLRAWAEWVVG